MRYEYREDTGHLEELQATSMDDAIAGAKELLEDGEWGEPERTIYPSAAVVRVSDDGEDAEERTVRIVVHPPAPECESDEGHAWEQPHELVGGIAENPGIWGKGGGVVAHEVCGRCGTERIKDTWAQDRTTGGQGLTSLSYEPYKHQDAVIEAARRAILAEAEHDAEATRAAICERHNCREAAVNSGDAAAEPGDVWIEGPQAGHWLDDQELIELVRWAREHHGWA